MANQGPISPQCFSWNLADGKGQSVEEASRFGTNEISADCACTHPHPLPRRLFCIQRRDAVALLCNAQSSLAPVLSLLLRLYNVLVLCLEHSRRTEQMTWTGGS